MLAAVLINFGCGDDPTAPKYFARGRLGTDDPVPDTSKASTMPYDPTPQELQEFYDLYRYTAGKRDVLRVMGHPMEIWEGADGMERWRYPWKQSCIVKFKGDYVVNAICH
jgi:hypothetical protein